MKKLIFFLLLPLFFSCSYDYIQTPELSSPQWDDNIVYNPEFTSVVGQAGDNILVRGSYPINSDKKFAYQDILNFLINKFPGKNFSSHVVIDVTVIDNSAEMTQLNHELTEFGLTKSSIPSAWPPPADYQPTLLGTAVGGHPGHLLWWPFKHYENLSWNDVVNKIFTGGYKFDGLVDKLNEMLNDQSTKKIIYYHCTFGKDRTGVLTFGWLVKHGNYSKEDAKAKVNSVIPPMDSYIHIMDDYWKFIHP